MAPAPDPVPEGSRDRVLAVLRGAPAPLGVGALQDATGLSANAVRFHLKQLIVLRAARSAKDPGHDGPGRPAILYTAAPAEGVDPASAYRVLAGLLARELAQSGRPQLPADAGRTWARQALSATEQVGSTDAVGALMTLFEDTGFRPTLAAGGRTIELHRCPFRELAVEHPEVVCGVHQGLVTGILEAVGARLTADLRPVLTGSGPCLLYLEPVPGPDLGLVPNTLTEERVP